MNSNFQATILWLSVLSAIICGVVLFTNVVKTIAFALLILAGCMLTINFIRKLIFGGGRLKSSKRD